MDGVDTIVSYSYHIINVWQVALVGNLLCGFVILVLLSFVFQWESFLLAGKIFL